MAQNCRKTSSEASLSDTSIIWPCLHLFFALHCQKGIFCHFTKLPNFLSKQHWTSTWLLISPLWSVKKQSNHQKYWLWAILSIRAFLSFHLKCLGRIKLLWRIIMEPPIYLLWGARMSLDPWTTNFESFFFFDFRLWSHYALSGFKHPQFNYPPTFWNCTERVVTSLTWLNKKLIYFDSKFNQFEQKFDFGPR